MTDPIQNTWTYYEMDVLRREWNRGAEILHIAKLLKKSKNSVIGKARRMCLKKRREPTPRFIRTVQRNRVAKTKQKAYGTLTAMIDLTPSQCRWPIGDMPDMLFCGGKRTDGKSYCAEHAKIAYRPK